MKRKVQAIEYECDACGKVLLVVGEPEGLTGVVVETTRAGGSGTVEWFACERKCVGKAVETALDKKWNQ